MSSEDTREFWVVTNWHEAERTVGITRFIRDADVSRLVERFRAT